MNQPLTFPVRERPKTWRFSRSHQTAYKTCREYARLAFYHDGKGIERRGLKLEAETGTVAHELLSGLLTDGEIKDALVAQVRKGYFERVRERSFWTGLAEEIPEFEAERQFALGEGLARAWAAARWPFVQENFNIIQVEQECNVNLGEYIEFMLRPDAIIERKSDGALFCLEFKTTGTNYSDYFESWRYSSQTLAHLLAIRECVGREGSGVMMEFLYKGYKREGMLYSPLLRGYFNSITNEVGTGGDLARKRGWEAFNVWERSSMKDWVEALPEDVVAAQLYAMEVFRNDRDLEVWLNDTIAEQKEVRALVESGRAPWRRNLDETCYQNKYRRKCPFLDLCYGLVDDPIGSGEFVYRKPHHEQEFEV